MIRYGAAVGRIHAGCDEEPRCGTVLEGQPPQRLMFDLKTARNSFDLDRDPCPRAMQNTEEHVVTGALSRALVHADDQSVGEADQLRRTKHQLSPTQAEERSRRRTRTEACHDPGPGGEERRVDICHQLGGAPGGTVSTASRARFHVAVPLPVNRSATTPPARRLVPDRRSPSRARAAATTGAVAGTGPVG